MTNLAIQILGDVGGNGAASHVTSGAVMTLVLPLALLAVVLAWLWLAVRRGWAPLRGRTPETPEPPAQESAAQQ